MRYNYSYYLRSFCERLGNTLFIAKSKSEDETVFLFYRIAYKAVSLTRLPKSAPENPSVLASNEIDFKSIFYSSGVFLTSASKMLTFSSFVGSGTYNNLSNLPPLRIAGSIISGRFVAAITYTYFLPSKPSSSASNEFTTLSVT